ncbi:MAG TPA: hypothetical protein VFQ82_13850 [Stellaceae bacterium]|nr:hypothetical protein [Stellaceae bacterium]
MLATQARAQRMVSRGWRQSGLVAAMLAMFAAAPAAAVMPVTAAAVWRPDSGFMARFHAQCDARRGAAFSACFVDAMRRAGANAAAVDFTRRLDGEALLQSLDHTRGPIAVAHVFYPFRANQNDAWLLVNGTPALIDVDNHKFLALDALRTALPYREIERHFPNVSFWPGDRGRAEPQIRMAGQEIVVDYLLRDQCHACAIIGEVRFAFDFDHAGRFLGTRLVSVTPGQRR